MKYKLEVFVNLPIKEFVKKFDNTENMKHWQRDLVSIEHISGDPGMVGAKMKLHFKTGKSDMFVTETITHRRLPKEFHGIYTTKGIDNIQENYFEELGKGITKWTSINEFIPLNLKTEAMLLLMPRAFRNKTATYMKDFKNFAEKGTSVNHEKA